MPKIVSNDSIGNDSCESKEICVAAPKGMTWSDLVGKGFELATKGVHYAYYPGVYYALGACRRTGESPSEDMSTSPQINIGAVAVGGGIGSSIVTAGVFGPVTPFLYVAGIVIGAAAGPYLLWNSLGIVVGARFDAETLFRKTKEMTLIRSVGRRYENFKRTPVNQTLRLRK